MILLSHPTVNHKVHHVARALERAGLLGELWTCREPACSRSSHGADAFASAIQATSRPGGTVDAGRLGLSRSLDREVGARLASDLFKGVYAFEDAAEESFRIAGERGLLRFYDLPAGHWRAEQLVCQEESVREPAWAATLEPRLTDDPAIARKNSELQQADLVFVASTFMLKTLEKVAAFKAPIAALRPGAPVHDAPVLRSPALPRQKLRALFIGPLGQKKGLSYLFRACRELRSAVSLTVIGAPPTSPCPALERELRDVRWQASCTAGEIRTAMAVHDVLLAPSLFEGFDSVIPEALASGLPVIATPHTAAPDLIEDGVEGFIVPVRSTEEIVARLDLLQREPERLVHMSANAQVSAQHFTWDHHERSLAASVMTALVRGSPG